MTPKEKAIELVEQFMEHTVEWDKIKEVALDSEYHAKQCALIAVEEVIEALDVNYWQNADLIIYWNEVKQEINEL